MEAAEGIALIESSAQTLLAADSLDAAVRAVFFYLDAGGNSTPPLGMGRVVNTKPISRLHEIVFEILACDESEFGPGRHVRAHLFGIWHRAT